MCTCSLDQTDTVPLMVAGGDRMEDSALRDQVRAAETEIANGHPDHALAHCQALQARFPQALIVRRLLGEIYLALNRPAEALHAMEWVVAADPDDARACCALAIAEQMRGDSGAALAWYRRACEIRPEDNMLRQAYRELAATRHQPAYRLSSAGLARLYLRGDQLLHAQTEWEAVLAQHPEQLDAQVGLAETLWRAGRTEQAQALAQHVIDHTPMCVRALLILCAIDHTAGREDEARARMQIVADLDPEQRMGHAMYAEAIAAGDDGLSQLLATSGTGAAAAISGGLGDGFGSGRLRSITNTDVMRAQQVAPRSGVLPPAAQADLDAVSSFGQQRSARVPDDFHSIFAETEFMLWGREDDDVGHGPAAAASTGPVYTPPTNPLAGAELPRRNRLERSGPTSPPPTGAHDSNLEDTESRAAIGWIRWLQAQGARPFDAPIRRVAGEEMQVSPVSHPLQGPASQPPAPPFEQPTIAASAPDKVPEVPMEVPGEPLWSAPEPRSADPAWAAPESAPEPYALMRDSTTGAEPDRAFDIPTPPPDFEAPAVDVTATSYEAGTFSAAAGETLWPAEPPAAEAADPYEAAADRAAPEGASYAEPGAVSLADAAPEEFYAAEEGRAPAAWEAPVEGGPTTLEALERADESAGFAPYDPHPGDLLALGREPDAVADDAFVAAGSDVVADERIAEPTEFTLSTNFLAASDDAVADGQDSLDGETRLARAREQRAQGLLHEALDHYGALLRQSPEHLDAVTQDLRSLVSETDDPTAHRLLGDAYIRGGDYQQALAEYNLSNTSGES